MPNEADAEDAGGVEQITSLWAWQWTNSSAHKLGGSFNEWLMRYLRVTRLPHFFKAAQVENCQSVLLPNVACAGDVPEAERPGQQGYVVAGSDWEDVKKFSDNVPICSTANMLQ